MLSTIVFKDRHFNITYIADTDQQIFVAFLHYYFTLKSNGDLQTALIYRKLDEPEISKDDVSGIKNENVRRLYESEWRTYEKNRGYHQEIERLKPYIEFVDNESNDLIKRGKAAKEIIESLQLADYDYDDLYDTRVWIANGRIEE